MRGLVYGLPIALSFGFVHALTSVTSTPTASLWIFLAWWFAVSLGATAVVSGVYALTRRLLPLGALLELSLVFPDGAPSRFRVALRRGTVASLEERVRLMRDAKDASTAQQAAEILLELVAALNDHDRITAGHAERVRAYSYALGKALGLRENELERLNWAALLHDIGKLEVSQEILNQAGSPSEDEWQSLRLHPLYGETLVAPLREWLGEWVDAVGDHHERWDGSGYPRGLSGQAISRSGRIVAIADAFDVITSTRSYKQPATAAEARAELVRHSGAQFDPAYVRAFVDLSLNRMRLAMGPVAWLSHALLLARLPLTPPIGAALGGAAAVATTTLTLAASPPDAVRAAVAREAPAPRSPAPAPVISAPEPPRRTRPERTAPPSAPRREPVPDESPAPEPEPAPAPPQDEPEAPTAPDDTPPQDEPGGDDTPDPPPSDPPPSPQPPPPLPPRLPLPNQPPTFAGGGSLVVLEDAGLQTVASWATAISPGPMSESGQSVRFTVTNSSPGLFAVQPVVGPDGTLAYTPAANASGSATVTVTASDDGGTADGGDDTSDATSFEIAVAAVNDAPTCSAGGTLTVVSLLGKQTIGGFVRSSPGPADESAQNVSYDVTTDRPGLFVTPPALSADGTLTFTPKLLALGIATVTVRAVDDGGTVNGGSDASAPVTFTIAIV